MKICFFPPPSTVGNKYIDIMIKCIKHINTRVELCEFVDIPSVKHFRNFLDTDYYHLNWYESLPNSAFRFIFYFIRKFIVLLFLTLCRKKIIFVLHNKLPHETKSRVLSSFIIKSLVIFSHKIIIHSNDSKEVLKSLLSSKLWQYKIVYMPHPHYIGAYPENFENNIDFHKQDTLKLLFVGMLRPYKNIEMLIDTIKEIGNAKIELLIAGKPLTKAYGESLKQRISDCKQIKIDFKFIPDEKICKLLFQSHILVLPYNIESSLNSGVAILAFSNQRTVICPLIGTIKDLRNREAVYYYNYSNFDDHKKKLRSTILKAKEDFENDTSIVISKGKILYQEMKEHHSLDIITERLKKVYS